MVFIVLRSTAVLSFAMVPSGAANSAEMEKGLNGMKLALKVLNEDYAKADKSHSSGDGAALASLVCWRSLSLTSPRV